MAALTEPNQLIKREELADYISLVDAKATPFISMAPKGADLGNTFFRWSMEAYDAPHGVASSVPDGTDVDHANVDTATNRTEMNNYGQVFRRSTSVGFLAQGISNVAGLGKGKEMAHQLAKRTVELKRDMEAAALSTDQVADADDATNAYETKGMFEMLEADGGGATTVPAAYRTPAASICAVASASLSDTNVQAVLTSIYGQTGVVDTYDLLCGTTLKRAFTNFTKGGVSADNSSTNTFTTSSVRTFNQELGNTVFKNSIGVFDGDFGTLNLVPDNFIGLTLNAPATLEVQPYRGYVINWDLVEWRYGMLPRTKTLPDLGGGPRALVEAFAGLVVKNPLGLGKFSATS